MSEGWWTEERTAELIRLWTEGKSGTEIKNILGAVSRSAVIGKVHRLKLPKRPENDRALGRINGKIGLAKQRREQQLARPKRATGRGSTNNALAHNIHRKLKRRRDPAEAHAPILLDVTNARPWIERKTGECAYPVGGQGADTLSCCAPCEGHTYCAGHRRIMFNRPQASIKPGDDGRLTQSRALRTAVV